MSIETFNFYSDPRVTAQHQSLPLVVIDDDGIEQEVPHRWDVCPTCDGRGTHVNPAIDCGGFSAEDFQDDPDFADSYLSGQYDVLCNECHGRTTVPVVDKHRCPKDLLDLYREQQRDLADCRSEQMAELRMGA